MRKASQRKSRPAQAREAAVEIARAWQTGDQVRWKDRAGSYRRDVGDGEHSEINIGERVYRVRSAELK